MRHSHLLAAGIVGLTGVLAGTFGAHVFKGKFTTEVMAVYETGVQYQLLHAVALLGLAAAAGRVRSRLLDAAGWSFVAGVVFFSGALYLRALTDQKWWGMVAPLGGVLLMTGWVLIAAAGWQGRRAGVGPAAMEPRD